MAEKIASGEVERRNLLPFTIRFEPRMQEPPRWFSPLVSLGAIVVALIIGGVVIAQAGGDPFRSYAHIARASFGSLGVFSDTLVKATPLILVGLACSVAFRMKLWNIGAEGQFFLGAFGASAVVLTGVLAEDASPLLYLPLMVIAG
ncbi:MAG: ABC transporter permease, partial [Anaerolineales bacterium]